jgi:L-aminopeptidase/D-esterase-like protein
MTRRLAAIALCATISTAAAAQPAANGDTRPARARELGLSAAIGGAPGPLDAITDVPGVEVGHTTVIAGEGPLVVGTGPVRTGVTVVHPRGRAVTDPVFGAWFTLNGNGEMTGTTWLEESGFLEGPIAITNTHSVGAVHEAVLRWQVTRPGQQPWGLPLVAETYDGGLNDINGFHVRTEHVVAALDGARTGEVAEGNVGGGTGMVCHQFKGGIGTASRVARVGDGTYTVGVLVQCNYGERARLAVAGVPVGQEIADLLPCQALGALDGDWPNRRCGEAAPQAAAPGPGRGSSIADADADVGSIIVVTATDAPLLPHQLKRLARRVSLGIGRAGGVGGNSSGDIFVTFSTANPGAARGEGRPVLEMLPNARLTPLFTATVQATEEAILNALLAARTMTGANGVRVEALPHDRLLAAMRKYGRLP